MKKSAQPTTTAKTPAPVLQGGKTFNPSHFVRAGVTEADILQIKEGFDLFDTDQGGSIDTNCTLPLI